MRLRLALASALMLAVQACDRSRGNRSPSAPEVHIEPVDTTEDLGVVFDRMSRDPEGDTIEYRYTWTLDQERQPEETSTIPAHRTSRGQVWEVEVVATDGQGRSTPGRASVTVLNAPPQTTVVVHPEAPATTDDLVGQVTSTDPDGDPVTIRWSWTVDGSQADLTEAQVPASRTHSGERWEVRAEPHDGLDVGAASAAAVVIGNLPPTVDAVAFSPAAPGTEHTLEALATVRDPDDDPVSVRYVWSVDGAVVQEGSSSTLGPSFTAKGRQIGVTVVASDGLLESAPVEAGPLAIGNSPPTVSAVTMTPASPTQDDILSAQAEDLVDPDGDSAEVRIEWEVGGVVVGEGPTLAVEGLARGSEVRALATPTDGETDGGTVFSDPVTVANTPPRIRSVTFTPDPAYEASVLEAVVDVTDPDGDPIALTYTWTVEGLVVQEGPTASLTGADFDKHDEVLLAVLADDGTDVRGPELAAPRVIANTPPTLASVTISPSDPNETHVLTCNPDVPSDDDGDSVATSWIWFVNGVSVPALFTLDGSFFDRDDVVHCVATPTDGESLGLPVASDELTIGNAPPDAVDATLSPLDPIWGYDDLVCQGGAAGDPDGDPVSLTYEWTVDGAPYSSAAGDRVPAAQVLKGREWVCQIRTEDSLGEVSAGAAATVLPEPAGGNVLVLVLDDVGNDIIGAYEEAEVPALTPNLDALAADGVLFRNAWAAPVGSPTRAALLTGRHGRRYGVGISVDFYDLDQHSLPSSEILLPELLRDHADLPWSSSLAGKWHLAVGWQGTTHPGDEGFDWHAGSLENLASLMPLDDGTSTGYYHWVKDTNGDLAYSDWYATSDTVDDAIDRANTMVEPWLLFVAFNAAHTPVHIPPALLQTDDFIDFHHPDYRKYRAMVEAADTEIGRLLAAIDPAVLADTTVIALGDNGTPEYALHPSISPPQHKGTLYEGGVNVPFLVSGPLVAAPGAQSAALVHAVDVFQTVAVMAGVDTQQLTRIDLTSGPEQPVPIDGISLLPYLADPSLPSLRDLVFSARFAPNGPPPYDDEDKATVRDDRWKVIRIRASDGSVSDQLYDLDWRHREGRDLLASGDPLDTEQQEAYDRVAAELDRLEVELVYDVPALPPAVWGVALDPEAPSADDPVRCTVAWSGDPNGDPVTLSYAWEVEGSPVDEEGDELETSWFGAGDTVRCIVTPSDGLLVGDAVSAQTVVEF